MLLQKSGKRQLTLCCLQDGYSVCSWQLLLLINEPEQLNEHALWKSIQQN